MVSVTKTERQLGIFFFGTRVEFLVKQAWLDVVIVLILVATVFLNVAGDLMVKDLADGNARVDSNGLNREHLQGPETVEANITKSGSHVDKQSQATDRRTPLNHRNKVVGFRPFHGSSKVESAGFKNQASLGNHHAANPVALLHVQNNLLVSNEVMVKSQVITVGVEIFGVERVNLDVCPQVLINLVARENHFKAFGSTSRDVQKGHFMPPIWIVNAGNKTVK